MKLQRTLSRMLVVEHPQQAARLLEELPPARAVAALEQVGLEAGTAVLRCMEPVTASACVEAWPRERLGELIEGLGPDHAAHVLSRMGPAVRGRVLAQIPRDAARHLRRLLDRPAGTAAALMDPRPPTLPSDISVAQARKLVQRQTPDLLYYLYLVDRERRLVGVVSLRQLLLARPGQALAAVMRAPVKRLAADIGWESIVAHPGWREFHAMPVVDEHDVLVGVLRYKTLRRLESDAGRIRPPGLVAVGLAAGEVYWEIAGRLLQETLELAGSVSGSSKREAPRGE